MTSDSCRGCGRPLSPTRLHHSAWCVTCRRRGGPQKPKAPRLAKPVEAVAELDPLTRRCPSCGRRKPLHSFAISNDTARLSDLCGVCRHLGEPGKPTLARLEEMSRRAEAGLPVRGDE